MIRKLMCVCSLAGVVALAVGCKDDRPTPMQFDPKAQYSGQQQQYKKGTVTGSTTKTDGD